MTAVLLALLASLLFGASASLQQRAASTTEPAPGSDPSRLLPVLSLARRLVRDPRWLAGWLTNLLGFLTQAAALRAGSVEVVQPLLVAQLLCAVLVGAALDARRPQGRVVGAAGLVCAGLALFLAVRPRSDDVTPDRGRFLLAVLVGAVALLLLVLAARGRRPSVRGAVVATGAGLCFATSAVLMLLTTHDLLDRGVLATARDWPGYGLACSTLLGLLLEQDAFASGPLPPALSAMTITNPVASYGLAVVVLGAGLPSSAGAWSLLLLAAAVVGSGVVGLAHAPQLRDDVPRSLAPARG